MKGRFKIRQTAAGGRASAAEMMFRPAVLAAAAALLLLATPGRAQTADTEAQAKAREALRLKLLELGAPTTLPGATNEPAAAPTTGAQPADFRRVPMINGIVIVRSLKEFNPDGVPLKPGLTVTNNALLQTPEFERLIASFMTQPMTEARMRDLQSQIVLYYRAHDRPLVDVLYPEQDVSNGMLQIIVIEGRLKEVKVEDKGGNPYTNGWSGLMYLHDSIRLRTNEVISASELTKDLDWLNRNPFRHVDAIYEPDRREYGLSSVVLRVDEQRQWGADFGYEDSGSKVTGNDRLIAGVTWGKAFGLTDQQFRYAFTTDPTLELLRVHSASYYVPLPWRNGLRFSGYYLDVKGDVGANVTLKGSAYQGSMRYEIPLPSIGKYQHEASIGADFKGSQNNLFFNTISVVNTPTEIFQAAAGYSSVLPDGWGQTSFSAQGYWSPGGVTDRDSDTFYNLARPLAKASYSYARFNLERATRLPADFSWIIRGMGQIADGNLLPSEQLGLGGYATVRGYDEREANGDEGFFMSNEIRTPAFSFLHLIKSFSSVDEKIQLLGFWDYGQTQNYKLLAGEDPHILLSSVGGGLRYSLTRHFSLRFDYGWQLVNSGASPELGQHSRAHLGLIATY